jgi:hypothetical protein
MHANVSRLKLEGTAGNIAVVGAPEGFPEGGAAVCHMSQEAFVPTISNERGLLSVVSKLSVFSFARQSAQISTLCLVSAATTHVDLKLTAEEVWVFGLRRPCRRSSPAGGPLRARASRRRGRRQRPSGEHQRLKQSGRRELDLGPPRRRQQRRQQRGQRER